MVLAKVSTEPLHNYSSLVLALQAQFGTAHQAELYRNATEGLNEALRGGDTLSGRRY